MSTLFAGVESDGDGKKIGIDACTFCENRQNSDSVGKDRDKKKPAQVAMMMMVIIIITTLKRRQISTFNPIDWCVGWQEYKFLCRRYVDMYVVSVCVCVYVEDAMPRFNLSS